MTYAELIGGLDRPEAIEQFPRSGTVGRICWLRGMALGSVFVHRD